jgi:hypothetical protein
MEANKMPVYDGLICCRLVRQALVDDYGRQMARNYRDVPDCGTRSHTKPSFFPNLIFGKNEYKKKKEFLLDPVNM